MTKYITINGEKRYGQLVTNENITDIAYTLSSKKWVNDNVTAKHQYFPKVTTVDEFITYLVATYTFRDTTEYLTVDEALQLMNDYNDKYKKIIIDPEPILTTVKHQQFYVFDTPAGIFWTHINDERLTDD